MPDKENMYGAIIRYDGKYNRVILPSGVGQDGQVNDASALVHWLENQAPSAPIRAVIQAVVPEIADFPDHLMAYSFEAPEVDEVPIVRLSDEWLAAKAREVALRHGINLYDFVERTVQLEREHPEWPRRAGGHR